VALALLLAGLLAFAGAILSLVTGTPVPAGAETYTVTSTDDAGPGTLRDAITEANANPGADEITIGPVGTITLASALPQITGPLTITGPGATQATLDGGGFQVFAISASKGSQVPLTVSGLTLTHPLAADGGLVANTWGEVVFDDVVVSGITSDMPIFTMQGGTFTLLRSRAEGNTGTVIGSDHGNTPSTTAPEGDYDNRTYIIDSTITGTGPGGWSGCVISTERRLYVIDSAIVDNWATGVCAGGLNGASFTSSTIARNGGHGVYLHGYTTAAVTQNDTTFDDVAIYDNGGWGIYNAYQSNTSGPWVSFDPPGLTIADSTIFGNAADVGAIDPSKIVRSLVSIPRPPSAVTGTAGEDQVEVTWTAPTSDSGSVITSSTVTATPGGATCTATSTDTSCIVTGLTGGTAYTFSVVANNANGPSWASATSAAVTPLVATTTTTPTTTTTTTTSTTTTTTSTAPTTTTTLPLGTTGGPSSMTTTTAAPTTTSGSGRHPSGLARIRRRRGTLGMPVSPAARSPSQGRPRRRSCSSPSHSSRSAAPPSWPRADRWPSRADRSSRASCTGVASDDIHARSSEGPGRARRPPRAATWSL